MKNVTLQPSELEIAYVEAARRGDQLETDRLAELIDAEQAAHEQRLSSPGALLDAALWYSGELGWPVFPVVPHGKRPATRHGFHDATTNLEQIRRWWAEEPTRNIGVPTGGAFDVIDIDSPQGLITFGPFLDSGAFDITALSLTPRGRHYLIPPTGQRNFATQKDIDFRGPGGYIVIPPSITPSGTYRWAIPPQPERNAA